MQQYSNSVIQHYSTSQWSGPEILHKYGDNEGELGVKGKLTHSWAQDR
jgi:hypothetical protein